MTKRHLLAGINILLILIFSYFIYSSQIPLFPIHANTILLGFFISINTFVIYITLFRKKHNFKYSELWLLTLSSLFWLSIAFFFSYFLDFTFFGVAVIILIPLIVYFLLRKHSHRIRYFISIATFVILLIGLVSNFEEQYCWHKGYLADPTNSRMLPVNQNGISIFVSWQAHLDCHETFNFIDALKDKLSF